MSHSETGRVGAARCPAKPQAPQNPYTATFFIPPSTLVGLKKKFSTRQVAGFAVFAGVTPYHPADDLAGRSAARPERQGYRLPDFVCAMQALFQMGEKTTNPPESNTFTAPDPPPPAEERQSPAANRRGDEA